jgi:hypothetical protein
MLGDFNIHGATYNLNITSLLLVLGLNRVLYLGALAICEHGKGSEKVIGVGSQKVSLHVPRSTGDFIGILCTTKCSFYIILFYENNCVPAPMNKLG